MKIFLIIQIFLLTFIFSACKTQEKIVLIERNESTKNVVDSTTNEIVLDKMVLEITNTKSEVGNKVVNTIKTIEHTSKPVNGKGLKIINVDNNHIYNETIKEGKVIYKIPSIMKVRNTYLVLVRISKSTVNIYEKLDGEIRQSSIPVTQTMEVKLIDPSPEDNKAFFILNDNNAVQYIDSLNSYTQWTWNVTPLRVGKTNLKVVVSTINGTRVKEVVYEDSVSVEANVSKQVGFWFKSYWQWLFVVILIPLIKIGYNKFFKKSAI